MASADGTVDCVYRQWFLEVFLGPFSNVNDRIMPSFSESFDDVMHCKLRDLQSLCNFTLRNVVFKVFHNLFTHSFTDWRASASQRHPFYS